MIKKLLSATLLLSCTVLSAQDFKGKLKTASLASEALPVQTQLTQGKSAAANLNDTMWYFYNKHRFRNAGGAAQNFFTIQMAKPTGTNIEVVEIGSSFLNGTASNTAAVTVHGAFILTSRDVTSSQTGIPIMVYLYNANPAGVPTTKVDSVAAVVTNTNGSFNYYAFATPKTVSNSFYVSYRVNSLLTTDTLLGWVNSATTQTSTGAANTKFGEGLSHSRLVDATNFDLMLVNTNLYGTGYDLEAIVAPVVSFSMNANYNVSAPNATATPGAYCAGLPVNFTNSTYPASIMNNRQFNFNKFVPYWAPFSFTVQPVAPDSITTWDFTNANNTLYTQNASHTPMNPGTFNADLTMKYRRQPFGTNFIKPSTSDMVTNTYSVAACGVGVSEQKLNDGVKVYPNPAVNGKVNITGLDGNNTITVYNVLGQAVSTTVSDKEIVSIDLSNQNAGNYFIRITNSNNETKVVKVINH